MSGGAGGGDGSRPTPPPCRLVAVDGNGTLLGTDGLTVTERARGVLGRVQDRGIPVVLVTGRPFGKAKPTLENAGLRDYVITENGARAVRISDGHPLYELWLDGAQAAEPIRRIKAKMPPGSCFFAQLTADGGLIEESHPWLRLAEGPDLAAAQQLFRGRVADMAEALCSPLAEGEGARRCAKAYVHVPGAEDFARTLLELQEVVGEGWEVRQIKQLLPGGTTNTCEVQSVTVNKADGLAALCRAIGVPMEEVWAFGDDANDARMLQEVGWGVRMANHLPALDGIGRDTTAKTNLEDGVAAYLEEHLLRGVSAT